MLGTSLMSRASGLRSNSRVFVYEVAGLKQNDENDNNRYPFRTSDSVFIKVPYARMNEQIRRIGVMGGTIVNITPIEAFQDKNFVPASESSKSVKAPKSSSSKSK